MNNSKANNGWNVTMQIVGKIFKWIGWALLIIPIAFFALVKGILAGSGYKK